MGLKSRPISTTAWERKRSQAKGDCFPPRGKSIPPWDAIRPKIKGGGQALRVLARLDNRRARPGGAVNGGALVRRSSRPLTAPTGFAIHLKKCVVFYSIS